MSVDRPMYILTQVAPYADGPAGVHGVLGQATTALAELAELSGLVPVVVNDVADLPAAALRQPCVLALFTIGETPFTDDQRTAVEAAWRGGDGARARCSLGHRRLPWVARLRRDHRGALRRPPLDPILRASTWSMVTIRPPPISTVSGHGTTRSICSETCGPTHGCSSGWPTIRWTFRVPGGRRPDCGFPLAWCLGGPDGADGSDRGSGGRTFYTALGHFPGAWETPAYLRHLAGGLAWLEEGVTPVSRRDRPPRQIGRGRRHRLRR